MTAPHQIAAPLHIPGPVFGGWSTQTEQQNQSGPPLPAGPAVPAAPAAPAPAAPAAPAPAAPAVPPAAPAAVPAAPKTYTPEETERYVQGVRDEARTHREAREAAEQRAASAEAQRNAILAAAGFNPDGTNTPPTPEKLQEQLSARDAEVQQTARENVVLRVGTRPDVSANVDKLLDSRAFTDKLAKLAPTDRDGIEALVKETLVNDGSYKAVIPAAAGGSTPATGAGTPPTARKSKVDAIAANYSTTPTR